MRIRGFHRVELVVAEDQIEAAVEQFNRVLGLHLPRPHRIQQAPVLSATDFDGSIELVAPVGGEGSFGTKLAEKGAGQIGPLVWEVEDIEEARAFLAEHGLRVIYEYDSSKGGQFERASGVYQLVLDPGQWFGFTVTLMQRKGAERGPA
jgi:catechol 2,3-dioxygenase-like lactoylglutathione lyase family enzyme